MKMKAIVKAGLWAVLSLGIMTGQARAEVILQYFQMPWRALTQKMPELAEAGYNAMWLPPPTKASGGLSVGYDLWDPFDLGGKDQRGTIRTRYGTEAELHEMIRTAHRFGIRIYFDNIMNHRAFDIPGFNETTPLDIYPGMLPEDFHLRVTEDGFYRKWDNTRDWNDEWQVLHLGLSDLIDIAHEVGAGGWNHNHGPFEGAHHPGITFVRHPNNPEYYAYDPDGNYVGFGNVTQEMLDDNPWAYEEDVNAYLIRAVRWKMDRTRADGLRLDAVKHVPAFFFGEPGNDSSQAGYNGGIQRQFNLSRGFQDWDNLRDSNFNTQLPRNDAIIFGEHLGAPPAFGPYISRGMRLKDAPLRDHLNGILGSPWGTLAGLDQTGWNPHPDFANNGHNVGVQFAHSHDSDFAAARELQYAFYMTRAGLPIVYTDGNFKAGTLQDSGGAFPRHANTAFLGQFADNRLPNLVYVNEHFARGDQMPHWSDDDVVAYSRIDKREQGWGTRSISDGDGWVMLFMMNDNYADGQGRAINTLPIGQTPGGPDSWLYNYSPYGGGFYVWASEIASGSVIIPPGGYFIFSWRTPEGSTLWTSTGNSPLTILQDGEQPGTVSYIRRDGPDGDPQFNPLGLQYRGFDSQEEADENLFRYRMTVPRITSGTNLTFRAHVDGSADNVLMKLNGGIDLNAHMGIGLRDEEQGQRDRPPGHYTDTFLGWENTRFVRRIWPEKFASVNSQSNTIGSVGATSYQTVVGSGSVTAFEANAVNDFSEANNALEWVYHDPNATADGDVDGQAQFEESGGNLIVRVKAQKRPGVRPFMYYTTDGASWPEGAGGFAANNATGVQEGFWIGDGTNSSDWWQVQIPAPTAGTTLRYKIGAFREQGNDGNGWDVVFPNHPDDVARKYNMMGVWEITNFNAQTVGYFRHNDWADDAFETGLVEGMNFIQARAFLGRADGAPLYHTFKQTFYLDLERPTGEVMFPAHNDTLPSQEYGVVVRTDPTVTEVWFNIEDSDPANDDAQTGQLNGNGTNDLGQASWAPASEVQASLEIDSEYEREWRFTYRNIPDGNQPATIRVRLLELSSTPQDEWTDGLSDEDGHFTTLERNVFTDGPEQRLFVAWPQNDGDTVGEGYEMKAYFSKSLADSTNFEMLRDRFTILLNGRAQNRDVYGINYDETADYHALTFVLPNLFNGDPDSMHQIEVRHDIPEGVRLTAFRQVRAFPTEPVPKLIITDPEQFDSNGRQTEIIIRDIADPQPEDREYVIQVDTDPEVEDVWIEFVNENTGAELISGYPTTNGNNVVWRFLWTNLYEATFVFEAFGEVDALPEPVSDRRSIPVRLRQQVDADGLDSDNDGLPDAMEVERVRPETEEEFWTDGQMHLYLITGRTDPLMPNTDGGGLPDGLQLGLRGPILPDHTDRDADTNGDGWRNFIPDLDPPIFNTTDNDWHPRYNFNRSRRDLIGGSMTDPSRADTDGDGLRDSEEDLNRNGRVDIGILGPDGKVQSILMWPNIPTVYNTSRVDRDQLDALNAVFLETDPNSSDTIGDGLLDGQSDVSRNGRVNMYLLHENETMDVLDYTDWNGPFFQFNRMPNNMDIIYWDDNNPPDWHVEGQTYAPIMSRAVHYSALFAAYNREGTGSAQTEGWPKLLITETDPLAIDTIGDGLPDGWKVRYGLDPLDDGVYNWRTGEPGNPLNGPDGDLTGDGFTNMDHFIAGTDPRIPITIGPPPDDAIIIGPGDPIGDVDDVPRFREFLDWTWEDLRAMDAFEGGGSNHQGGDIYPAFDGWDSSRDMVAFYTRDGGSAALGGTGQYYFRVDFHDLQAFAEQGNMDLYVAINFGSTEEPLGERVLPDEVDTLTDMRWRAVVAVYESSLGTVYVDTDAFNNTDTFGQSLEANGVVSRPDYFLGAYFNSELDAVEFAIDRAALEGLGWLGSELRFQVYTVKSGTQNSPQGPGDIGGRSDIRDSIMNDWIAENHWFSQAQLQGTGSVLTQWIPETLRAGRTKVALVIHGNQHIRPGSEIMDLINNNEGAGYYRPIDAHEVFGVPLNLHITPTLASAIQWASADPVAGVPWRDGPSFNARLAQLMEDGIVSPFATTFSDHILPYFTTEYNADNVALANEFIEAIYGFDMSDRQVFFPPERVLDADTLNRIQQMGFNYTLVDQMKHLWHWLGRETALGQDGYRINRINGVNTFAINDRISTFRFQAHDGGAPMALRRQLNSMARSGTQDQVLIIYSAWEDFLDRDNAAAYDALVRWLANRAWVEIVTLEDIANNEVDLNGAGDNNSYWRIERGSPPAASDKMAHDWIHFATRENYDNWYVGEDGLREGLLNTVFDRRPGEPLPEAFGMLYTGGLISNTWDQVRDISAGDIGRLARGVAHASTFVTAFHDQPTVDLRKFSTGVYIWPDSDFRELAGFARVNHAQTRRAAIYARVDQWAGMAYTLTETQTSAEDIDLDGEDEYLIYNANVFAVLERTGGRMIGAWVRNPLDGRVFQVVGNFMSYAGSETEWEGTTHIGNEGFWAYRTSGLKDWWANTSDYINEVYDATPAANGWTLTSDDELISKTVTLPDDGTMFHVQYNVSPSVNGRTLFVRHGLSPDLYGLLLYGQSRLSPLHDVDGTARLSQIHAGDVEVRATVAYDGNGFNATFNAAAVDQESDFHTVNMRNQAQTHQVEIMGNETFSFGLGFEVLDISATDNDGVPFWWLEQFDLPLDIDVNQQMSSNLVNTIKEAWIAGLDPNDAGDFFRWHEDTAGEAGEMILRWASVSNRLYDIFASTNLLQGAAGFTLLEDNIPATPPMNVYTNPVVPGAPMEFYRIDVHLPE